MGILVVTTERLPGYRIIEIAGEVIGISARSYSPFMEGFNSLEDGSGIGTDLRRRLLKQCRWEAVEQMVIDARRLGANAVVAMRFDHRPVTKNWVELCAYGTAVLVVPLHQRLRADDALAAAPGPG